MRRLANPQGRSKAEGCGGAIIWSKAAARRLRSMRGNNRAAALSRGAAPVQVTSPVAGMVLQNGWSEPALSA
ncbi:hypothetical protein ATE69_06825 [Sphingopyxis sp. H071]|nr:hypothetical protein ATE64_06840 [Sphingopyxis sp. H073]KTE56174.1 hypothetical protein ATE69_06825 [Sphingopyxis sp. H071]KTE81634.1 hypothetical protein ATE63_06210 [Sphingopyxis sp. H067]